jgi:hypothetical protein
LALRDGQGQGYHHAKVVVRDPAGQQLDTMNAHRRADKISGRHLLATIMPDRQHPFRIFVTRSGDPFQAMTYDVRSVLPSHFLTSASIVAV